jgi:hypothetical protein
MNSDMPSGYWGAAKSMRHTGTKALTAVKMAATISSVLLSFDILPAKFSFIDIDFYKLNR